MIRIKNRWLGGKTLLKAQMISTHIDVLFRKNDAGAETILSTSPKSIPASCKPDYEKFLAALSIGMTNAGAVAHRKEPTLFAYRLSEKMSLLIWFREINRARRDNDQKCDLVIEITLYRYLTSKLFKLFDIVHPRELVDAPSGKPPWKNRADVSIGPHDGPNYEGRLYYEFRFPKGCRWGSGFMVTLGNKRSRAVRDSKAISSYLTEYLFPDLRAYVDNGCPPLERFRGRWAPDRTGKKWTDPRYEEVE